MFYAASGNATPEGTLSSERHKTGYGIVQSIFGPASRRERLWQHMEGDRRDGGLKMSWTKPVPSAWPYGY
jgi:hypothetical protein